MAEISESESATPEEATADEQYSRAWVDRPPNGEAAVRAMSSTVSNGQEDRRKKGGVMRRLILQTGISIDGYVAALDKSHPWGVEEQDEGIKQWVLKSVWAAGAHLMGRATYEEMASHWPTSTSDYARPMNELPNPAPLHLELVEATAYPSGVAVHVYRPRSRPADQTVG